MKVSSLKTIYLTETELKEAIIQYLWNRGERTLSEHLNMNACTMDWGNNEFAISIDGEVDDSPVAETKEEHDGDKRWIVKVEHLDATDPDRGVGELCVRFPDELMEQLGWNIGDEVEWDETEICEDWGEHKGFTLSNVTKGAADQSAEAAERAKK